MRHDAAPACRIRYRRVGRSIRRCARERVGMQQATTNEKVVHDLDADRKCDQPGTRTA
jgi:hypothetical protein